MEYIINTTLLMDIDKLLEIFEQLRLKENRRLD